MGNLLSYSGLTTKLRAMESQLMTLSQLEEIVQLPDVSSVAQYLKRQPAYQKLWENMDEEKWGRSNLERLLRMSIYQNFIRIYRFSNAEQRKYLQFYMGRYEIRFMKKCLANLFVHRSTDEEVTHLLAMEPFFHRHFQFDLSRMLEAKTIEEFLSCLEGSSYYASLHRLYENGGTKLLVFDYGMTMDQFYFSTFWKNRSKMFSGQDLKEITLVYGQKMDLLNLTWIYRSKHFYHLPASQIYALLIPLHHKLRQEEIRRLVEAETPEIFQEELKKTKYGRMCPLLSPESLDETYNRLMREILCREATRHPHTVVVLYSYLYQKEHEVNRLTTAVECVRYQIPPQEAMEHIRKS